MGKVWAHDQIAPSLNLPVCLCVSQHRNGETINQKLLLIGSNMCSGKL